MASKSSAVQPFDMVVVGASGDLARRKLLPALYFLHKYGALPLPGRIIGAARPEWSRETYLESVKKSALEHIPPEELSDELWASFAERLDYVRLAATEVESFTALKALLAEAGDRDRIFYLATPPDLYGDISRAFAAAGLVNERSRIVLEKPIGHDLASAQAINSRVGEVFREHQIYRIDHYLGKETVQNLMALRFGNALFEPLWSSDRIDHVQITVAERIGVEGRGAYYDSAGALRDMVQNHLLQLLCLVAMEPPSSLEQKTIRGEKIKVLRALRPIAGDDVVHKTVRGQYLSGAIGGSPVPGYLEEEGIEPKSRTETFVALKLEIDNWRWAGVPFYLRTGKRMQQRVSEIILQFKRVPHQLFRSGEVQENRLVIRLQPDEGIRLGMNIKVPGSGMELKPVYLNLNMADTFEGRTPQAYERLLMDVIRGNPTLFMHRDEVEEAWQWLEPIVETWRERNDRPRLYTAGTWGPPESVALIVQDKRVWYEHLV